MTGFIGGIQDLLSRCLFVREKKGHMADQSSAKLPYACPKPGVEVTPCRGFFWRDGGSLLDKETSLQAGATNIIKIKANRSALVCGPAHACVVELRQIPGRLNNQLVKYVCILSFNRLKKTKIRVCISEGGIFIFKFSSQRHSAITS
jgi:hypothetical protein